MHARNYLHTYEFVIQFLLITHNRLPTSISSTPSERAFAGYSPSNMFNVQCGNHVFLHITLPNKGIHLINVPVNGGNDVIDTLM